MLSLCFPYHPVGSLQAPFPHTANKPKTSYSLGLGNKEGDVEERMEKRELHGASSMCQALCWALACLIEKSVMGLNCPESKLKYGARSFLVIPEQQ